MNRIEYTRMYAVEDRHWWYMGLHELILAAVQRESARVGRPLVIFDAGCGTGRLCQLLRDAGHGVSGCDASAEALRLCSERGVNTVYQADLNSLELEPAAYDLITSIDVLYHTGITDDVAVMQRLRAGLKPGGMLILNLVAFEFLRSTHDIAVHTRERYTIKAVRKRLESAGFTVAYASYRVSALFPLIALYRRLAGFFHRTGSEPSETASDVAMPPALLNSLLLRTVRIENRCIPSVSLPFGSSLFAMARNSA